MQRDTDTSTHHLDIDAPLDTAPDRCASSHCHIQASSNIPCSQELVPPVPRYTICFCRRTRLSRRRCNNIQLHIVSRPYGASQAHSTVSCTSQVWRSQVTPCSLDSTHPHYRNLASAICHHPGSTDPHHTTRFGTLHCLKVSSIALQLDTHISILIIQD